MPDIVMISMIIFDVREQHVTRKNKLWYEGHTAVGGDPPVEPWDGRPPHGYQWIPMALSSPNVTDSETSDNGIIQPEDSVI